MHLGLKKSKVSDSDCLRISDGIESLKAMKHLELVLDQNEIGDDGFKDIIDSLIFVSKLETLSISISEN